MSAIPRPAGAGSMQRMAVPTSKASTGAPWLRVFAGLVALCFVFLVYRIYQETTAFTHGLDYFSGEFQAYWMRLLYTQLVLVIGGGTGVLVWLWRTRERDFSRVGRREELRRLFVVSSMLLVFGTIFYITGSIYTESDAAWHQVTIRDTDFTPTHIGLFYFGVPVLVMWGFISFAYAHTRIPYFGGRISLPFAIIVAGAFMIMPNLGFNEWGHTFFYAEELFAAPIHWGFVMLGWSSFAAGGLLTQIATRVMELTRPAQGAAQAA
ncbi:MAG: methane monooxygenase/ammonia monooxygenase subunit C [Burkholderiales bacterium]|nr:methane monooxygenase/ammonia monooxygenase subunit C [Burkholderiales bacterium]